MLGRGECSIVASSTTVTESEADVRTCCPASVLVPAEVELQQLALRNRIHWQHELDLPSLLLRINGSNSGKEYCQQGVLRGLEAQHAVREMDCKK